MSQSTKITSKVQLVSAMGTEYTFASYQTDLARTGRGGAAASIIDWWAVREYWRLHTGYYKTTDTLNIVNGIFPFAFAHISKEDPKMVAFTVDRFSGEADKQLRLSIGKLLSKLMPWATNHYVADLVADHDGEINGDIDWVVGEDIAEVYRTDKSGFAACMSNKAYGVQPTIVYDAPGFKMATLRKADGSLSARAMCYEEGDRKVYTRLYGDKRLARRLDTAGFCVGNFAGTKLRKVEVPMSEEEAAGYKGSVKVAVPYIDANGSTARGDVCSVAILDGELRVLTEAQANTWGKLALSRGIGGTNGALILRPVNSTDFRAADSLTGETLNLLTEQRTAFRTCIEGQLGHSVAYPPDRDFVQASMRLPEGVTKVWAKPEETFQHRYTAYVETDATRLGLGFYRLDEHFYPDDRQWHNSVRYVNRNGVDVAVKQEDTVRRVEVVDGQLAVVWHHKSEVAKDWVKLHSDTRKPGGEGYAAPGVKVYRTGSNRKVHPLYNQTVVETLTGYEFAKNVQQSFHIFGEFYHRTDKDYLDPKWQELYKAKIDEVFEKRVAEAMVESSGRYLISRVYGQVSYWSDYYGTVPVLSGNTHYTRPVRSSDDLSAHSLNWWKEYLESYLLMMAGFGRFAAEQRFTQLLLRVIAEMEAEEPEVAAAKVEIEGPPPPNAATTTVLPAVVEETTF